MALFLTPLVSDPLTVAANPLDPTKWTVLTGFAAMEVTGGHGQATSVVLTDGEIWTGRSFPNDQYCSVKLVNAIPVGSSSGPSLGVRSNADASVGYFLLISDAGVSGHVDFLIDDGIGTVIFHNASVPYAAGDVFTLAVVGTTVYGLQNGVLVGSGTGSTATSGTLALGCDIFTSITDVLLNNFIGGSASTMPSAYSVPDCRTTKPNSATSRNVNGTLTYDKQTSSNAAVPSKDCRASKPVASNKAYPQNSRTPGTIGPGE